MALKTNETATLFSQKKLLGKAHTSNLNLDVNESIGSTIQSSAGLLFGETIPTNPSLTLYTVQGPAGGTNTVEYVEFALEVIPGSTYDANDTGGGAGSDAGESSQVSGPHAYAFKFQSDYESNTNNSRAGNGSFDNNKILHETLGAVQIIPPFYSRELVNPYIIKIYKDDGAGGVGDEIPLLDDIDWQVDTYNGVLFVQDYNALKIPAFARAFIYVGKMLDEKVQDAASSGGSGSGISAREKYDYNITTTYLSGSEFFVSNSDFSAANYDPTLIDVYRNGQLILSGTNSQVGAGEADYFVNSSNSIKIGFDLFADDVITVSTYGTDTTINREKNDYELITTVFSGSAFTVSNSDLAGSSYDPTLIDVFHNGQLLLSGTNSQVGAGEADYFIYSSTQLKFGIDLFADDIISVVTYTNNNSTSAPAAATYLVVSANSDLDNERVITAGTGLQSTDGGAGGNFTIKLEKELVFNEVLGGNANGSNTYFTFANTPFSSNDVSVFVNGQLQVPNDKASYQDYSVTGSHLYFTTGSTPELGSLVMAIYNKVVT